MGSDAALSRIPSVCHHRYVTKSSNNNTLSKMQVMTAQQWAVHGVTRPMIRSLVRSGGLVRMRQGVYATRSAVRWAEASPVRLHVLDLLAVEAHGLAVGPGGPHH